MELEVPRKAWFGGADLALPPLLDAGDHAATTIPATAAAELTVTRTASFKFVHKTQYSNRANWFNSFGCLLAWDFF